MKFKKFGVNISLVLVSVFLCLAVFEVGLRAMDRDSPVESDEGIDENVFKFYEYDPLLGWRNKSGAKGEFQTRDSKTYLEINSKGLRDVEHSYNGDGRFRILVLGDSFVWGYGVQQDKRFTDCLQRMLGESAEVINAGVSGYGTDQEYLYYKSEGVKYSPDLVILTFGSYDAKNDNLQYTAHTYPKPRFEITEEGLHLANVPVPERKGYEWEEKDELEKKIIEKGRKPLSLNKRLRTFFRRHLKLYAFVSNGIKKSRDRFRDLLKSNPRILDYMVGQKSRKKKYNFFILTEEIMKELDQTVKSNDAKLVVLIETYRSHLKKMPDGLSGRMIRFCDSQGIPYIDPFARLFQRYKNGEVLYFKHDEHWNELGHRLIADEVYDFLIKNRLIQ